HDVLCCTICPPVPIRLPPAISTLFPYTTLFRSELAQPEERRHVGYPGRLLHVVRDDHDRVVALQFVDEFFDVLGGDRVERRRGRSEEHTSELQSREKLVCRLLHEKKYTCSNP